MPVVRPHHSAMLMKCAAVEKHERLASYWKFNNYLLRYSFYKELRKKEIDNIEENFSEILNDLGVR